MGEGFDRIQAGRRRYFISNRSLTCAEQGCIRCRACQEAVVSVPQATKVKPSLSKLGWQKPDHCTKGPDRHADVAQFCGQPGGSRSHTAASRGWPSLPMSAAMSAGPKKMPSTPSTRGDCFGSLLDGRCGFRSADRTAVSPSTAVQIIRDAPELIGPRRRRKTRGSHVAGSVWRRRPVFGFFHGLDHRETAEPGAPMSSRRLTATGSFHSGSHDRGGAAGGCEGLQAGPER